MVADFIQINNYIYGIETETGGLVLYFTEDGLPVSEYNNDITHYKKPAYYLWVVN